MAETLDQLARPLRDLRVSVTDRCNFRCAYCMPKKHFGPDHEFLRRQALLSFEELARLSRIFGELGVRKVRLTGGEPLLRRDLPTLVAMLVQLDLEVALTTNGVLLPKFAKALAEAGLSRITVSLDSLDPEIFRREVDAAYEVEQVLSGIAAAQAAGFSSLKINAVIRRGKNESSILELARHFRGTGHIVRFIEYMDVGKTNQWNATQVITAKEIVSRIDHEFPVESVDRAYRGEVAQRYRYKDGQGEIGVIASVSSPFCGDCTRLRLSADGKLFSCLFAHLGYDIKNELRSGRSDEDLKSKLGQLWQRRSDRYSELRSLEAKKPRIEMSYIGG